MPTDTAPLTRLVRARTGRARCAEMARQADAKAARYPAGSALHADWADLAADYRATVEQWSATIKELEATDPGRVVRRSCTYCEKTAEPGRYECHEHDDGLPYGEPIDSDPLTPGGVFGYSA